MTNASGASGPTTIDEPARTIPVIADVEVVVVGGGPAGMMAAVAAAKAGRSTLLVEGYGFLGGAGTMGGLSTFCGMHARVEGVDRQVVHGYADELLERMSALDGLNEPHLTIEDRIMALSYDISVLKIAADTLVVDSGAELLFHTRAAGLSMGDDGRIEAVIVESKSGRGAIRGQIFIDASGDADLAAWAGAPFEHLDQLMYPSLMFRINGVHPAEAGDAWRTVRALMDEAEASGERTFPRKKPIVRPQRSPLEWRANLTQLSTADGRAIDGTDARQLTRGELQGRRQIADVFAFIRERTPGFQDSYVVDIAPQIGIRETRRIVGEYVLTEDDVLLCADAPDSIGVNGWPVEAHVTGDVAFRFTPEGSRGFNQLPYRMLLPLGVENLLVAGRCASMTQGGQSSGRVTGPCFVMGQAAGTAADLALGAGVAPREVDVAALQRRLEDEGAYLGLGTRLPEPA